MAMRSIVVLLAVVTLLAGCGSPTDVPVGHQYELVHASGDHHPVVDASVRFLSRREMAEHREFEDGQLSTVVQVYRMRGDTLEIETRNGFWWRRGVLDGDVLTLTFQGPADGPITETYVRRW